MAIPDANKIVGIKTNRRAKSGISSIIILIEIRNLLARISGKIKTIPIGIRKNGMKVECFYEKDLSKIPVPSILDVNVNNIGHVIVYLGSDKGNYIIGDPLEGRVVLTKDEFQKRYKFDGFVMSVNHLN